MGYPEPYKTANPDIPKPEDPQNPGGVPKLGLNDTQALPANSENLSENQAIQRNNQAESDRLWNYQRRASMEAAGQQHYTDPFGNIQPVLDQQTGKPLFKEQDYVDYDQQGKPFRRQVDKFGNQTVSDPDANAPVGVPKEDPFNVYKQNKYQPWQRVGSNDPDKDAPIGGASNDPGNLYKQNQNQPWSYVGNAYDIVKNGGVDQATADAAKKVTDNGRNDVGGAANEGIGKLKAQGELDLESAKQREQQLQDSIGVLSKQQDTITNHPEYGKTAGGFLGIGAKPTDQASKLKSQNDAIQSQIDALSQQQQMATQERMKSEAADKRTKLEAQMLENTNKLNGYEAVEQKRRQALISQGKTDDEIAADPVLDTIQKKKDEVGLTKSKVEQQHQIISAASSAGQRAFQNDPASQDDVHTLDKMFQEKQDAYNALAARASGLEEKLKNGAFTNSDDRQAIVDQYNDIFDQMHHAEAEGNAVAQVRGAAVSSLENNNGVVQSNPGKRNFNIDVDPEKMTLNFSTKRNPKENQQPPINLPTASPSATPSATASPTSTPSPSPTPSASPTPNASSGAAVTSQSQPPASTPKREVGFWEALGRTATEGAAKTNQFILDAATIMPYLSQKAAEAVGSDAKPYNWALGEIKKFQNATGIGQPGVDANAIKENEKLTAMGHVGAAVGPLVTDLPIMALTGGASAEAQGAKLIGDEAPTILQAIKDSIPHFEHGLKAMSIPAARAGSEEVKQAQAQGSDATTAVAKGIATAVSTDLTGVIPMSATSGRVLLKDSSTTANLINGSARFLERGVIGWLAGIPIGESQKVVQSWIDGRPYIPEDLKSMVLDAAPMALMSGALGGSTAKEQPSSAQSRQFDAFNQHVDGIKSAGGTDQAIQALQDHYAGIATKNQPGLNKTKQYGADVQTAQTLNGNLPEGSQPFTPEQVALARTINPTAMPDLQGAQSRLSELDTQIADAQKSGQNSRGRGVEDGVNHPQNLALSNSNLDAAIRERSSILNDLRQNAVEDAQKSDMALKSAQEIHSLPDQGDQTIATGISKIANGQPIEHLTGEEKDSLLKPQESTDSTTGQTIQSPALVRIEKGQPVITDSATRWMEDKVPTAAQMIPLDETGQLRQIYGDEQPQQQQRPTGTPDGATTPSGSSTQGQPPVGNDGSGQQGTEGDNRFKPPTADAVGSTPDGRLDSPQFAASRDRVAARREANASLTAPTSPAAIAGRAGRILQDLRGISEDLGIQVNKVDGKAPGEGGMAVFSKDDGSISLDYNPIIMGKGISKMLLKDQMTEGDADERLHHLFAEEAAHLGLMLHYKDQWSKLPENSKVGFNQYVRDQVLNHFDDMHQKLSGMGDTQTAKDLSKAIISSWNSYYQIGNSSKLVKGGAYEGEKKQTTLSITDENAIPNALKVLNHVASNTDPKDPQNAFLFMNEFSRQLAQLRVNGNITENADAKGFLQIVWNYLKNAFDSLQKVALNTKDYHSGLDEMVTATADRLHAIQEMIRGANKYNFQYNHHEGNYSAYDINGRGVGSGDQNTGLVSGPKWAYEDGDYHHPTLQREFTDYLKKPNLEHLQDGNDETGKPHDNPEDRAFIEKEKGRIPELPPDLDQNYPKAQELRDIYEKAKKTQTLRGARKGIIDTRDAIIEYKRWKSNENETSSQQQGPETNPTRENTPASLRNSTEVENPVGSVEKQTDTTQEQTPKKLSDADQALKDFADGLEARKPADAESAKEEEIFDKGLPVDKMGSGLQVAQKLISEGIKTPEAFAAKLHEISPDKLPKYSKAIWNLLKAVDPSLEETPDWKSHFETARAPKEAPETDGSQLMATWKASPAYIDLTPESHVRVNLNDGSSFDGIYKESQGTPWISNNGSVFSLMDPENVNHIKSVNITKSSIDAIAELESKKYGEIAYQQPKTRDDYENTLYDLSSKIAELTKNHDSFGKSGGYRDDYNSDARRIMQLEAQFNKVADEIGLSQRKRFYILKFVEAGYKLGDELKHPISMVDSGDRDMAKKLDPPKPNDFDPDHKIRRSRSFKPIFMYDTKARVEQSLADAQHDLKYKRISDSRRTMLENVVKKRTQQLKNGTYREAIQDKIDRKIEPTEEDSSVDTITPENEISNDEAPESSENLQNPELDDSKRKQNVDKYNSVEEAAKTLPFDEFQQFLRDIKHNGAEVGAKALWQVYGNHPKKAPVGISNHELIKMPGRGALNNVEIEVGQRPNGKWVSTGDYQTSTQGSATPFNHDSQQEYPTRNEAVQSGINRVRSAMQNIYDSNHEPASHKKEAVKIWQFLNQHDPSGPKELKKTPYTPEQIRDQKHSKLIADASAKGIEAAEGKPFEVKDVIDNQGIAEIGGIKKAQEAIEAGIADAAHQIVREYHQHESDEGDQQIDQGKYKKLINLYENQPTLGAKTSTSKINQAYSTPAPLAYVASKLGDIEGGFSVYEPSAGHGMLLIDTTAGQGIYFNEIDPNRVQNFNKTRIGNPHTEVSSNDAVEHAPDKPVDRVITNPPFGSVMGDDGKPKVFQTPFGETTQIDHAIVAKSLDSLITDEEAAKEKQGYANSGDPNQRTRDYRGRATLIIGGPAKTITSPEGRMAYYGGGQRGAFFKYLYDNYGVVDHFTVNGDLYKKQGAGWPVDVITLVGTKPSEIALPSYKAPRMINTWDDLWKTTQLTDEQRIQQNRITEDDMRSKVGDMVDRLAGLSNPRGEEISGQQPVGNPERNPESGRNNASGTSSEPIGAKTLPTGEGNASGVDAGGSEPVRSGRSGGSDDQSGDNTRGESEQSSGVRPSTDNPPRPGNELTPEGDQFQVAYEPFSKVKGLDTLIPTNMASAVKDAFSKMEEQYGDLGKWVHSELGYKDGEDISKYLSGEQVDGVAAAIHNFKNDGALIIGDQTGIGKGRIAAALMRWAEKEGLIPIFVTKDRTLQSDMLTRDLVDVGAEHIVPALLDSSRDFDAAKERKLNYGESYWKEATAKGELHKGANAIFTTYEQLKADTDRQAAPTKVATRMVMDGQAPPGKWRTKALNALGPKAVYILDESHLAAGKSTTGYRMRDLLDKAKHAYYSSATAIKRPETMGIYFKTALGKMAGGMDGLVELMNHGGVPAMQIASQMLARAGQYLRRERSFEGIKFNTHITEQNLERDARLADNLTQSLRTIMGVQDKMKEAADAINGVMASQAKRFAAEKGSNIAMDSDFASQLHNVVSQYLLAIKSDAAAQQAIEQMRQGKKVVVTVQNTMEGIVDDLKAGGFDMSYKGITQKYLDGMLTFKTGKKNENGEHEKFTISGVPDPAFENLNDQQLARAAVIQSVKPDGTKVVEADPKAVQELMRRRMWEVHQKARAEIDKADLGDLPISPIDYIRRKVEQSGDNFATEEITGRKTRLDENNEIYTRPDHEQKTSIHKGNVIDQFNNRELNFVILNQSGSTGISMHAGEKFNKKNTRVMIVAQPHQDINEFMQTLGRINRSGQVTNPEYILLQTALPAEKRPAAILASKMAKLNANTTSNAKSDVSEGIKNTDIYNKYGDEIAFRFLMKDRDLSNQLFNLGGSLKKHFFDGEEEIKKFEDVKNGMEDKPDGHIARMITSYLAVLPVEEQQNFWDKVTDEYNAHINYLNEIGQNDLEAKPMDIRAKTLSSEVFTQAGDGGSVFADPSHLETVHAEMGKKPISGDEAATLATNKRATSNNDLQNYEKMARNFYTEAEQIKAKRSLNWTDEKKENFLAQQRQMASTVASGIRMMGRILSYDRPDGTQGLAVIESVDLDQSNPLTPSKQIFTIRTNDTTNTLKVPASQIDKFQIAIGSGAREWDATADSSNTRNIVTGNLLAALNELRGKGQVINYTTDTGENKMGILLPNNFTKILQAEAANRRPINDFQKFQEVAKNNYDVRNSDNTFKISSDERGNRVVEVPQSKSAGGKYWQNPTFNSFFSGGEMIGKGSTMRGTLLPHKSSAFFDFLKGMGENLFYSGPKEKNQGLEAREPASPEEKMQAIRDKMAERNQENLGKLSWDDEDLNHDNTENSTEKRAPSALSERPVQADLESGGSRIAIPAEQPLGEITQEGQREYDQKSNASEIARGESEILDWAKQNNRIIPDSEVQKFSENSKYKGGGSEHSAWKVSDDQGNNFIIRATKDGTYGFDGRTPLQYLKRMADVSQEAPDARVDFLGVSQQSDGKPVIWTRQPFVEGDHPSNRELEDKLIKSGWQPRVDQEGGRIWVNKDTGIAMHDAHSGNFIVRPDGKLLPIDVYFSGIKDKPVSTDDSGRNSLFARKPASVLEQEIADAMPDISDLQDQAKAEKSGKRTIGNPSLGLGALDSQIMGVDEYRKSVATKEKESQWHDEGKQMLDSDYAGTRQRIIDAGMNGGTLNPAETKAAQMMVAKELAGASTDSAKRAELAKLIYAYRQTGTEQARGLRSRVDPFQSPAERHREFLAKMIFSPSPEESSRIDQIKDAEEKSNALSNAVDAQMESAKKALESMGVSLDDILNGEVKVSLVGSKVSENLIGSFRPNEQTAIRLLQKGKTFENTAKATGLSVKQVENLKKQFQDGFRARHFSKFEKGMTPNDIEQAPGLRAARPPVAAEKAEENFQKALELMGMGADAGLAKKKPNRTFNIADPVDAIKLGRAISASNGNALNMVHEYWMSSILSGMVTHAANFTGMGVNGAIDYTIQRGMEALVNSAIGNPEGTQMGEFKYIMKGIIPGVSNAVRAGLRAWDAEQSMIDYDLLGHNLKLDQGQIVGHASSGSIPGKTGRIIRMPMRALAFMDDAVKTIIAHMEVGAQAYRSAKAEGYDGDEMAKYIQSEITTPGSQSWERAVSHAVDLAFQTPIRNMEESGGNIVEAGAEAIQRGLRGYTPGKFFIPFIRILYNIPRVGLRKSPIGTATMLYKMGREGFYKIQNGKLNPHPYAGAEMIRDTSEQVLAWSLMAALWGAAAGDQDDDKKKILFTGSNKSTSKGEKALSERLGVPAYHIKINGTTYNYGRIEPIATVLGTTLDLIRTAKSARDGASGKEIAGQVLDGIKNQFTEKSFGKGLKDIAGVTSDPQNAADWVANFAASFVPNLLRQPIRASDPYVRETSVEGNPKELIPRIAQRVGQSALPFGSLNEPRIDLYGNPIKKEGTVVSRLTPMQGREVPKVEPADKLFANWNAKHPDEQFAPDKPTRRYVDPVTGKVNYMDDKMFRKYSELAGKAFQQATRAAINPQMAKNPTEEDHKLVKKLLEQSRKDAKQQVLSSIKPKSKSIAQMLFGG